MYSRETDGVFHAFTTFGSALCEKDLTEVIVGIDLRSEVPHFYKVAVVDERAERNTCNVGVRILNHNYKNESLLRYFSSALTFSLNSFRLSCPAGDSAIQSATPKEVITFRADDSWQDSKQGDNNGNQRMLQHIF